jgi:urea transport system substrate-binding protein
MRLRLRAIFPFAWVVLPVLGACLVAVLATEAGGPLAGLIGGAIAGLLAAFAIERPLRILASVAARIGGGDRYAIVPKQPKGPLSKLAEAAESLRAAVIRADSLAVDQRRREAEARLHYAGRSFFTRRFRSAVDEVTNAFAEGSGRIGNTAADLAERNRHMHVRIATASDAAEWPPGTSMPSPLRPAPSWPASAAPPAISTHRARPAAAPSPISLRPTRRCAAWRKPPSASMLW